MNYHDGVAGSKEWFQRLSEVATKYRIGAWDC